MRDGAKVIVLLGSAWYAGAAFAAEQAASGTLTLTSAQSGALAVTGGKWFIQGASLATAWVEDTAYLYFGIGQGSGQNQSLLLRGIHGAADLVSFFSLADLAPHSVVSNLMWLGTKLGEIFGDDRLFPDDTNVHITGPQPDPPQVKVDVLEPQEREELEGTIAQSSPAQPSVSHPAILTLLNLVPPLPDIYVRRTRLPRTDFPAGLTLTSVAESPVGDGSTSITLELQSTGTSNLIGRFLFNIRTTR